MSRASSIVVVLVLGGALLLAGLNLFTGDTSAVHVPTYAVSLVGKYLCYAILALAVDLVWGFAGILSLGHAAFFALGGYAMGMYLMRQIGSRGQYGNPILPDFMVFLNFKELPWYWLGFNWFPFALLMAIVAPAVLAYVFGWLAFRSRVSGVYLSIITQALTYALLLAFFRNDMGFGGNNGLTDFKELLGFPLQLDSTRCALLVVRAAVAVRVVFVRAGADGVAVRQGADRGARYGEPDAVFGLSAGALQAGGVGDLGGDGRVGWGAVRAAGRDHQSGRVRAGELDRGGDLGGGRRARNAVWGDPGGGAGQSGQDACSPGGCRSCGCSRWGRCSSW